MREKIRHALKACCKAIKSALEEYNMCAAKLNPLHPALTWTSVIEAIYLRELNFLRDTCQDICTLKWAQPAHCEAMNLHFDLKCAHEEIPCLDTKVIRILTFMRDNHIAYYNAICNNIITNPTLAYELSTQLDHQNVIHKVIYCQIHQTSMLPSSSVQLCPGLHVGRDEEDVLNPPPWMQEMLHNSRDASDWVDEPGEEEVGHDMQSADIDGLLDYMDNLEVA